MDFSTISLSWKNGVERRNGFRVDTTDTVSFFITKYEAFEIQPLEPGIPPNVDLMNVRVLNPVDLPLDLTGVEPMDLSGKWD